MDPHIRISKNILMEVIDGMKNTKLTMRDILDIGLENINEVAPQTVQDLPWALLRKAMALDRSMRSFALNAGNSEADIGVSFYSSRENLQEYLASDIKTDAINSFNPLDFLCVLLHCSDHFVQQYIYSKMSMCQFAVPLLLPAGDGPECTFMLWAMRDIVKSWRPQSLSQSKSYIEENLVWVPLALFSFVRLGKINLSKSKILNLVLSQEQQYSEFFIHENIEGGNIEKKISNGMVEISWYFPAVGETCDTFQEPIAVANLRGELESNWTQFSFLTQVSTAVFIFVDSINEEQYKLLSGCKYGTTFYIILTPSDQCFSKETVKCLQNLFFKLNIKSENIFKNDRRSNDAKLSKNIQLIIRNNLNNSCKKVKLENIANTAAEVGINVDENCEQCQKGKEHAKKITRQIKNVIQYKKGTMKLQGQLWKKLSQTEKELCRMRNQGDLNIEEYKSQLLKQHKDLHSQQNQHDLSEGMIKFISAITQLTQEEKLYFLKWMKFTLDSVARKTLSELQAKYKEQCLVPANKNALIELDQQISDSSLGIEHFIREMGQFYEAECSMVRENRIQLDKRRFSELPKIASNILLDGFPLELVDGDASNIPLQWVTDVLTEINTKTGGKCRMRVITVLGVQSTGKSTLLNTMFGLQFSVSSGRCTRGAFITLIKVKDNLKDNLGCDFILVIDTEGLKAPELASLEDSYEHDNELATLVVGLSDITIVNIAMENATEMKDTLQIVVHAFLRMSEIGKRSNCQFVHQNVNDVSAHDLNMRDRKTLLEQLNQMTKVAANMEKRGRITRFSDIMDYNLEKDNWYIPGLWYGVPPMASVNSGYSENVYKVKKYLFKLMEEQKLPAQNICQFIEWIKSLWNSVKHENFIFSFRNSLVAEAYDNLSVKYSQWEWNFRKQVHSWLINSQNMIKNQSEETTLELISTKLKDDLFTILSKEESDMLMLLKNYFASKSDNVKLILKFQEEFFTGVKSLRKQQEYCVTSKINEAVRLQKGKMYIKAIQSSYQANIEKQVSSLLDEVKRQEHQFGNKEIEIAFETMWKQTLSEIPKHQLEKRIIQHEILQELKRDITYKAGCINQKFLHVKCLDKYEKDLTIEDKHIDVEWFSVQGIQEQLFKESRRKISELASSLKYRCSNYVKQKVNTGENYDVTYCQELLNIINERLREKDIRNLHITHLFELDLKLHIFGSAAPKFQMMHERFLRENDPVLCLEKLKCDYLATFKNIFEEGDETVNRAKHFCELCLKPAITDHVNQHLGKAIVDDILHRGDTKEYCSRTFFQFTVLKKLLDDQDFTQFVEYIESYEQFVKAWITQYIFNTYNNSKQLQHLQVNILSHVCNDIREVLKNSDLLNSGTISDFLESFCRVLQSKLIISQNDIKVVIFQNKSNIQQFSNDIELFLTTIEQQIRSEIQASNIKSVLSKVTLKPEDELFLKVFGCGKQCPFCKVPCEAGGTDHKEHFASVHRPQGLGSYQCRSSDKLVTELCSTDVVSDCKFRNSDTNRKYHPYKKYRTIYPDWAIQPDPSITASDYWKFIYAKFNNEFAEEYEAKPADLPDTWQQITEEQALQSLMEIFNMK